MNKIFLLLLLSISLWANPPLSEDIQLFLNSETKMLTFGGITTPECKIQISQSLKSLEYVYSSCTKLTNSKGIKIICNHNKSVCKTESEIYKYLTTLN